MKIGLIVVMLVFIGCESKHEQVKQDKIKYKVSKCEMSWKVAKP
jgi:hypothetical protein